MKKIIFAVALLFLIIFLIVISRGTGPSPEPEPTQTTVKTSTETSTPGNIIISDDIVYHQDNDPGIDVPFSTKTDPDYPSLSVYWVQQSVSGGQDTCTMYDSSTKQIYANRYIANSQYVSAKSGTAYYTNTVIKQDKALSLLDKLCFKP